MFLCDICIHAQCTISTLLGSRSKMKVIKMLLLVVVLFAMSWLPLYAILTRVKFGPPPSEWEWELIRTSIPMAQCLGSSNSCINPILYAFFNKKYRTGFKVREWIKLNVYSWSATIINTENFYAKGCSDESIMLFHTPGWGFNQFQNGFLYKKLEQD